MKIELICEICKKSLANNEIKSENGVLLSNACVQIESPFCVDCANKYMYSNGTMKLEGMTYSNPESALG